MGPLEKKLRDMEVYLPFLEEKIERIKRDKLRDNFPDPERESKLSRLQMLHRKITGRSEIRLRVESLEKCETIIQKLIRQDELESRAARVEGARDPNPFHNAEAYRPSSSCSNTSVGSGSSANFQQKKVFDDTPASPSPPRSPAPHTSAVPVRAPIIIPTESSRFMPSPPPPPSIQPQPSTSFASSSRASYLFRRSPTPPPEIPKIVPIARVDMNEIGPMEWDTDDEDSTPSASKARPEIVVPKPDPVVAAVKQVGDKFPRKEEIPLAHKRDPDPIRNPSDNIPTVRVDALDGSRRLKSVLDKTNVLNDLNLILPSHRPHSPLTNVPAEGLRSPDPSLFINQSPSQPPFSPSRRTGDPSKPITPSLLLSAPPTNSRMPIPIDDIAEYLDDSERSNLRKRENASVGPLRPPTRMSMPNSSPSIMSPRSDASAMSPCHTDPRLSGDPRSRPNADPRSHIPIPPNDPRSHGSISANDPRNHAVPRYADNYERHKRSTLPRDSTPGSMSPAAEYQRQRHLENFGQDTPPSMVPPVQPPMHPMQGGVPPGPGPGPGYGPHGSHGPHGPHGSHVSHGPHGQVAPMTYGDYRMAQEARAAGGPMPSPQQQQQQWNGPPHPHMQPPGPPQPVPPPHGYQMGQGMRDGPPGWQQQGHNMYQEMQPHPGMMNGDSRMGGGYGNQMPPNMARNVPPLMNANTGYGKYPNYSDSRPSYDMGYDQQQQPHNEYQRGGRPSWGGNSRMGEPERFSGRPTTPFPRPAGPNSWNSNKEPPRPNRDPREAANRDPREAANRDPRTHRPEPNRPNTPTFQAKETPKGPPPGKEVHPNKLAKQAAAEKEAAAKKRPDHHKSDLHKTKDKDKSKDKDKGKDKDKDKDKHKNKSKSKSSDLMKSPLTDLYGAIDAKKAVQATGLNKFKIPKKRSSVDARPEPAPAIEESWEDDDVVTSSSASHEPATKQKSDSTTKAFKKSGSLPEKEKSNDREEDSSPEPADRKKSKDISEIDILEKLAANKNLSKDDLSSIVKELMKKLKKKSKKTVIYSSDEDDEEGNSSDDRRPTSSSPKKPTRKKSTKQRIESSSDEESEISSEVPVKVASKKDKKKATVENKDKPVEKKVKKKEKKKDNEVDVVIPERSTRQSAKEISTVEPAVEKELVSETPAVEKASENTEASPALAVEAPAAKEDPPVKAKPKRRFRELDMLQEDLKSSWICDGAMKATGSRTCSQKNKPQEQQHAEQTVNEEEPSTSAKNATGKMKKPQPPKAKPKAKKVIPKSSLLVSSDSEEDDIPLSRRTEGLNSEATSSTAGKKTRAKSVLKVPPPLFDESSNDSFNLDASVVEPTTDISLHPESDKGSGKGKTQKKAGKKTSTADAESSSDESFVSNASSSLIDSSSKQRDNNQELLDDVMAELATNPKYTVAKKKQTKKKRGGWQMVPQNSPGILSKKKRKKAPAANKVNENISQESITDTSLTNANDTTTKENDTSATDKNLERTESLDKLAEEEGTGWKSTTSLNEDEDLTTRVDSEALIGYTMYGNNEKYQCLLCPFYRKNIVHHYKMQHPKKEVLISRLPIAESNLALEEAKRLDFENNPTIGADKEIGKYKCRFCSFVTKGVDSCARESFYEHCTNHTGEYRFSCQNCGYEAVAKGSIRTHYYKECRKHSTLKNLTEAIVESPIPTEDRIYGYLCAKCNFVQLKRCNVEKHIKIWHSKEGIDEIKIIKIDMSLNMKREDIKPSIKNESVDASIIPQNIELKDEKEIFTETEAVDESEVKPDAVVAAAVVDETETTVAEDEPEIRVMLEACEHKVEKVEKIDKEVKDDKEEKVEKPEKVEKSSNLSAFVCPDELENKEMEIKNERIKKMQEIAQNIGIKFNKNEAQKRFSILDTLKDKMDTSHPAEEVENTSEDNIAEEVNEPMIPAEAPEEDAVDPLQMPEEEVKDQKSTVLVPQPVQVKLDPDATATDEKEDKSSAKIKDPLAFVDKPAKRTGLGNSDDDEHSDGGMPPTGPYEESDESEHEEMSTDVSSILQNTGEIGSPSKGLMMTTIQRLAAQLQNTKPLETLPEPEATVPDEEKVVVKQEVTSPKRSDDDTGLLSPSKIKKEVKKEPLSPQRIEEPLKAVAELSSKQGNQSPKKFIRIRRISGDKLSKGGDQETSMSNLENDQSVLTMATIEPNDPSEEDTGFLKIANVVSLAPKENDNQMVSNLRKVVETSPQKMKSLSILKKPNSFILKRVDNGSVVTQTGETVKLIPLNIPPTSRAVAKPENFISIGGQPAVAIKIDSKGVAVPLTMTSAGSTTTNLVTSNNQPFKLLKIATPEQVSVAIKLKSADVYEKMLKDDKLIHMFKCMGRDCCFTTSSEPSFHKHLRIHEDDPGNKTNNGQKDYFKCAYCYIGCKTYDDLMTHLKKMHIFCRYCCKYCFYRAFAYSYVEIHQKTYHQMNKIQILVVSEELVQLPPPPKRLDRKQIIKPYVCVHECNKYFFIPEAFVLHLNMHHTNIVSGFRCHLCPIIVPTVDNLIEHYKQHGYFKYHCMYCAHGSATIKELHNHLSSAHYNQPPHILERCLPREISKSLSAIDQLRVRDVDAIYRQRNKTIDEEHLKVAIPPLIKCTSSGSMITNAPIMTAKIISPKDNKGQTFVPITNLDGGVSNIRILDARSLSTNNSLLNIGKNIKVTVTEAKSINNSQAAHTISDDNSEFVSTNFLDQTDVLSGKAKIEENKSIDYDSDIEIIEDYTSQSADSTKLPSISQEKIKEEAISEEVTNESNAEPNESDPLSTSTSESSAVKPSPSESPASSGRFLTLDDVKGTGFEGRDLYRCGVESCQFAAETAEDLRQHMQQCGTADKESTSDHNLYCVHCGPSSKNFGKPSFFIDHLKTHGVKRFMCALCNAKFAVQSQAQSHLRAKHKYVSSRIVPADPMNPSPNGLFIIHPMTTADRIKSKKQNKSPEKDPKLAEMEKTTFNPSEIDKLPLQAIYNRAVQCAVCPYSNKVRSNMLRHLQAHLKDESVPDSSPVNPVPCLDKKERMFDKMVNLASSSHENGRMGGGGNNAHKDLQRNEDEESLPKYVPENKRYVCGVPECNYLTVEEAMLRHHLKALHSDELYFRCPHCPQQQQQTQQTATASGQDMSSTQNIALDKMGVHLKMHDSRLYKCSHCIYHHYHRHVVERHLTDKHPEKRPFVKVIRELQTEQTAEAQQQSTTTSSQETEETELPDPDGNTWKCNLCDFKSVYKSAMQNHAAQAHDEKCQFRCNGCNFKTTSKVTFDQHMLTKHANESNVDFTTIYQRIKGLKKSESAEVAVPQDEPFDTTPLWRRDMPRIRHIRGILLEEEEENEGTTKGGKRKFDADGKPAKIKSGKSASLDDNLKSPEGKRPRSSIEDVEKLRTADGGYGSYGTPIGDQYVCPICGTRSKYKHDFRDHLYRDLKYLRWYCPACDYKAVTRAALVKHFASRHSNESLEPEPSTSNAQIEDWVANVLKSQTDIIKNPKISMTETSVEEEGDTGETDDEDMVIDIKEEEEIEDSEEEKVSSELLPEPLNCKHCNMNFTKWRGFKRHVQLKHLKRLGFLCPYCDRSTNSEAVLLQHLRSKHREMPEKVIENPNPFTGDLTPEFWEREYGLVVPKRAKKRKKKDEIAEDGNTKSEFELTCDKCDFVALTSSGLKSHARTHETKIKQKCSYCTFITFNTSEMRQHWEMNHQHLEFKVEEAFVSSAAMDTNQRAAKKAKLDDEKKATVYYCYYCNMGSTSLDAIRSHWRMMHMEDGKSTTFKYREHSETRVKCAYCGEAGTKNTLVQHIWQKHGKEKAILLVEREEDGWMCKWCSDEVFLTNKEEIDSHQRMCHSHLRVNLKIMRRTFKCNHCAFDTISLEAMQKHAKNHLNVYKCKYCTEVFKTFSSVKHHFKDAHPDKEAESRTITSDDLLKEVDFITVESSVFSSVQLTPVKVVSSPFKSPPTSPRLAKKSTTKQIVVPIRPFPDKIKAVARKSTNPLPRYAPGVVFETVEETPKYESYYGRTASPVDLGSLSTTMAVAGLKMKVNCAKLAELFNINIEPTLRLKDFRKEKGKDHR